MMVRMVRSYFVWQNVGNCIAYKMSGTCAGPMYNTYVMVDMMVFIVVYDRSNPKHVMML